MNFDTLTHYVSVALAIYKAFAVVVTVASIMGIVYVVQKSQEMRRANKIPNEKKGKQEDALQAGISSFALTQLKDNTIQRWHHIVEKLSNQQAEKDFKTALIEADALVDAALRAEGFSGETMADRLRSIPVGRISSIDDMWKAHRVRNEIAHDPHYTVSPREGHDMMKIYKKVLEELGAL